MNAAESDSHRCTFLNEEKDAETQSIDFFIGDANYEVWHSCTAVIRMNSMPDLRPGKMYLYHEDLANWERKVRDAVDADPAHWDFEPVEPAFLMTVENGHQGRVLSVVFDTAFMNGKMHTGNGIGCQISCSLSSLQNFADRLAACLAGRSMV
jgi:hypothetical protein